MMAEVVEYNSCTDIKVKFDNGEITKTSWYKFNMNICIQIRDVLKLLQQHYQISFEEAALKFYKSETYKTLQETENGLWAESAEYIADRYYEEADFDDVKSKH